MSDAPLMLSVSGARGIVGQSLTPVMVSRYAGAFGSWLRETRGADGDRPVHVVIGRDSRPSGDMVEMAAVAGLLAVGCRVTRLGIATTPGTAIMTEHLHADGGMVVTASHNPIIWNGLKPLRHDGVAPPKDQAQRIIGRFREDRLEYVDVHHLQPVERFDDTPRVHVERVLKCVDAEAIRAAGLKVVVDSVHGAGGAESLALMHALGVELVRLYPEPTGLFPHEPEPLAQNLGELCEMVQRCGADAGFAQDPDADRLAIVDEQGAYIGEEYTLALCAQHVLREGQVAVANLSTSRMIDDVAAKAGATVVRCPVGEANVAEAMREHGAVLGGEGNGGVILPQVSRVRDSLVGMALVLEMLAKRREPLSQIVGSIPRYAIVKEKMPVNGQVVEQLSATLERAFADQRLDRQDGVRIDWPDRWVHVRPSNTEPIIRLIAEASDESTARALIDEVRAALPGKKR